MTTNAIKRDTLKTIYKQTQDSKICSCNAKKEKIKQKNNKKAERTKRKPKLKYQA